MQEHKKKCCTCGKIRFTTSGMVFGGSILFPSLEAICRTGLEVAVDFFERDSLDWLNLRAALVVAVKPSLLLAFNFARTEAASRICLFCRAVDDSGKEEASGLVCGVSTASDVLI